MKQLNIAIMGCASIAQRLVIPAILKLKEHFCLKYIASRTSERAEEFAKMFDAKPIVGYDELLKLSDVDVIYMPLPTGLHEEWVIKTLQAGKHILIEKSLAMDLSSAKRMISMANESELVLMENFMFQYHKQHRQVWKLLEDNVIGDIRLFRSQFGFPPLNANNFRYDITLGGGSLLDAAAYTVKAALWYLGETLTVQCANLYFDESSKVDIHGNATLINDAGKVAQVSFGFDNFYQCNYEIWGSKGKINLEKAFTPKPNESTIVNVNTSQSSEKIEVKPDNHFENILMGFYNTVLTKSFKKELDAIYNQSRLLTEIKDKANIKFNNFTN